MTWFLKKDFSPHDDNFKQSFNVERSIKNGVEGKILVDL